jgi:hypothetical protein
MAIRWIPQPVLTVRTRGIPDAFTVGKEMKYISSHISGSYHYSEKKSEYQTSLNSRMVELEKITNNFIRLFRLKWPEERNCSALAAKHLPAIASSGEAGGADFCIKHGFKVCNITAFPNSLQPSVYLPE